MDDIELAYSFCYITYGQPCNCEKAKRDPCLMMQRKAKEPKCEAITINVLGTKTEQQVRRKLMGRLSQRSAAELPYYHIADYRPQELCESGTHTYQDNICINCGWIK